jgi:DNA mismatch endonuclease (patch repair protein)
MTDVFNINQRSAIMRSIHSRGTKPELALAKLLRSLGIRYRSHPKRLPGNPDFVLMDHTTVVFVHGCFWHQHKKCGKAETPVNNRTFWIKKLKGNVIRDRKSARCLRNLGFSVIILWECELKSSEFIAKKIQRMIKPIQF